LTVKFDRRSIERHLEALTGRTATGPVEFEPSIDTSRGGGAAVAAIVREIVSLIDREEGASEVVTVQQEEWLLDALLLGLPHNHSDRLDRRAPSGSLGTVLRAEEYIAARMAEPLTVRRVALATGVSVRTLQRSFARHREYSPKQFLSGRRLVRARRILLSGTANVTEAALASGHGHLGQFSVDYRRTFGESPSETLRRRRGGVVFPIAFAPSAD
jgi:transcriptional regulator GlxA family with amidase domain